MTKNIRLCLVVFFTIFSIVSSSVFGEVKAEEVKSVVWLGFPVFGRDKQPASVDLTKDQMLGSAFLLQLQRQALLIAARDELGVYTADEFMGEKALKDSLKIEDIGKFPNADVSYKDHPQFLAELEKRSRNEFVAELKKRGVKKQEKVAAENNSPDEKRNEKYAEIEKLLNDWALIPQFEAVRRTHRLIREIGETPELLTFLVRGYTQLQMLTNIAPLDTHRVFQARAMLYAQRIVAKYGEKPEWLALRAAAWSFNNFHRLARLEFDKIKIPDSEQKKNTWIDFAKYYAEFDFKGLVKRIETADPQTEQPLGKLLYFFLLDYSTEGITMARPYGEKVIADLPDCSRLYIGLFHINHFDMVYASDNSPFNEHLARRIAPAIKKMKEIPNEVTEAAKTLQATVKKSSGGSIFNLFGGGNSESQDFSLEQYYRDFAAVLKALSAETTPTSEPSLSMLSYILRDDEFQIIGQLAYGLKGHNGNAEEHIMPAMPVIGEHPDVEFLGLACRDRSLGTPFWHRLTVKTIPYNIFSQKSYGFNVKFSDSDFHGRIYSPYYFASLFIDRENVRDWLYYHNRARLEAGDGNYYFAVDILRRLCPKNPHAMGVYLVRGRNVTEETAEAVKKEFVGFPGINDSLAEFYIKKQLPDKIIDLIKDDYAHKLTRYIQDNLTKVYIARNEPEKAIDILKKYLETDESKKSLMRYNILQQIGFILLQEGKIKEAEQYLAPAMQTYSGWGLMGMGQYKEITGSFDEAEKLFRTNLQAYPESRYGELWGFLHRINSPRLKEVTDDILKRYARYKAANIMDTTALMTNLITNAEIIFPCYCMDIPYPPQLGNNVLVEELFRGDSYIGMLAWLDAMKQKDKKQSENLLHFLRELWFLHEKKDPFIASQRKILPKLRQRKHIDDFVQKLAAIFEADQKTQKPASSLKKDEIDFLIQTTFADHFFISDGAAAFLCYALGRYYDIHGDKDSAADYYRRVLGFRVRFDDYVRSLAVKELRKTGLTNEEYVRYSQADPKVAKNKISHAGADVFCRQLFRDYSDSPSGTILAKQPAEKIISGTDFGKTVKLVPGWYQVTKILFRGHVVADITDKEKVTVVYWRIPKEDDENDYNWGDRGIAHIGKYNTELQKRRDDGLYPVRFSLNDSWLPALASFHNNGNMALVLSLNPNNEPKKMTSDSDSSCVRIEMKKVTDIPEEEPLIVAPNERNGAQNSALQKDEGFYAWIGTIRYAAITVAGTALILVLIISIVKKKHQKKKKNQDNNKTENPNPPK